MSGGPAQTHISGSILGISAFVVSTRDHNLKTPGLPRETTQGNRTVKAAQMNTSLSQGTGVSVTEAHL